MYAWTKSAKQGFVAQDITLFANLYQHFLSDKGAMLKLIYKFSCSFQETVENLKLTRVLLNKMVNRLYLVIQFQDCVVISETTCFEAVAQRQVYTSYTWGWHNGFDIWRPSGGDNYYAILFSLNITVVWLLNFVNLI